MPVLQNTMPLVNHKGLNAATAQPKTGFTTKHTKATKVSDIDIFKFLNFVLFVTFVVKFIFSSLVAALPR
jgi:hypothetical protein